MEQSALKYDPLEIARIVGEPVDPRKPYPDLVDAVCTTDEADPDEYYYQFDVLLETDKVYVVTSTGAITQENVTTDSPVLVSFVDLQSPEYYVKLIDLAKSKERTLARKKLTINRAMDAYENYNVISATDAAIQSGNSFTLRSGYTRFVYPDLVDMIHAIIDYADNYVLVVGTTIDKDIKLWNWDDNKYQSLSEALADLQVRIIRVFGTVTIDGSATSILDVDLAYLYGINSAIGKPLLFVRKRLNDIEYLGGTVFTDPGSAKPQRIVVVSPNPVTTGSPSRFLGVGLTGFSEIALAVQNPYSLSKFSRS